MNRKWPSWLISTQHGAVWLSANGEARSTSGCRRRPTLNAETVPVPAPSWALDTYSWLGFVGRNSLPNGPSALRRERRTGGRGQPAVAADGEAVDQRRVDARADELRPVAVEQHVTRLRAVGQRDRRAGDRMQPADWARARKPRVVAAAVAGVGDVDEAAVDGDADRLRAARRRPCRRATGLSSPSSLDPQHRDLVAAGVDREQKRPSARQLDRALRRRARCRCRRRRRRTASRASGSACRRRGGRTRRSCSCPAVLSLT